VTTETEIQEYWKNNLVKVSTEFLNQTKLDETTKHFLATVGLPIKDDLLIIFTPHDLKFLDHENSRYIVVAKGYSNTQICLQEETGKIYLFIDIGGSYFISFLNSDIKSLVIFVQLFESFYPLITKVPVDEREEIVQELRQKFLEVDPEAISDYPNRWVTILEELEYDLI
jgi:hypothetical protein